MKLKNVNWKIARHCFHFQELQGPLRATPLLGLISEGLYIEFIFARFQKFRKFILTCNVFCSWIKDLDTTKRYTDHLNCFLLLQMIYSK